MVHSSGAHSTDMAAKEDADELWKKNPPEFEGSPCSGCAGCGTP